MHRRSTSTSLLLALAGIALVAVAQVTVGSLNSGHGGLGVGRQVAIAILVAGAAIFAFATRHIRVLESGLGFDATGDAGDSNVASAPRLRAVLITILGIAVTVLSLTQGRPSWYALLWIAAILVVSALELRRLFGSTFYHAAGRRQGNAWYHNFLGGHRGGRALLRDLLLLTLLGTVLSMLAFGSESTSGDGWRIHLASIVVFVVAVVPIEPRGAQGRAKRQGGGVPRRVLFEILAVGAVLLLAAVVRLWQLEQLPFGFWYDEANDGLVARQILTDPNYRPVFLGGMSQPAHFDFLIALSMQLFGDGVWAVRAVAAGIGIASVLFAILLFRRWLGPAMGIVAGLLLATMRYHITFSRWAIISISTPLLVLASIYFLDRAVRDRRLSDFAWMGLAVGFGAAFYRAYWLFGVALAVFLLGCFIAGVMKDGLRLAMRRMVTSLSTQWLIAGLGAIAAVAPVSQLAIRDPQLLFLRADRVSIFSHRDEPDLGKALLSNTSKHLGMFTVRGDSNGRHNLPGAPMLDPIMGGLFVLGAAYALWHAREAPNALMLVTFTLMLLGGILTLDFEAPQSNRAIGVIPSVVFFASLPLAAAVRAGSWWHLRKRPPPGWKVLRRIWQWRLYALPVLIGAILLGAAVLNLRTYFVTQRNDPAAWSSYSTSETLAASEINARAADYDIVSSPAYFETPTGRFLITVPANFQRWTVTDRLPLLRDDLSRGVIMLFDGTLLSSYEDAKRVYPDGEFIEHHGPNGRGTALLEAILSHNVLASVQGVEAAFYQGLLPGGHPVLATELESMRVDPKSVQALALPFNAVLRSTLVTPEYGPYRFGLRGTAEGEIWIDEFPAEAAPVTLARGSHLLRVQATGDGREVELMWQPPSATALEPIPTKFLFKPSLTNSGLLGTYYPTPDWSGPPAFAQIDPQLAYYFHIIPLPRPYSVRWTGKLYAPTAGTYELEIFSVDGSKMKLDGKLVLESPEGRKAVKSSVPLSVGWHDITVDFEDRTGGTQIYFYWTPPDGTRELVPSRYLSPPMGAYPASP